MRCPLYGRYCSIVVLAALLWVPAQAGTSARSIHASRSDTPPRIDGILNETAWSTASPVLDFTQSDPDEGALPTEVTSVRILYTDHALYVGVICYDAHPDAIVRQLSRRDRSTEADRFTVQIDSYHDHRTAFVFSTNVSGVQSDGVLSQDGNVYDITWDAVWSVATHVYEDGWSAEFEIPFNALRFTEHSAEGYTWGINFRRYISRKRETIEWVMVPRTERLLISRWGHLTGVRDISPSMQLSIVPFVSGSTSYQSASNIRPSRSDYDALGGLDLKYGLSRDLTLDVTVNPDFGQVEVDQAVLNLTVFETHFPEKRPFFVEGSQVFAFGASIDEMPLPLFFSRRIGRRPTLSPFVRAAPGGVVEENPQNTTILGAAKVSGRTESGLSVGVLTAGTDKEVAVVKDSLGRRSSVTTERGGSYTVARLKQEFGGNSWVGMLATAAVRDQMLPAFSGGLDWNIRFAENSHTFDGYVAATRASVTSPDRHGSAGKMLLTRIAGEHWFYLAGYDFFSRHFNPNDLGFFARPHDHGGSLQLLYRENYGRNLFRRYAFSLSTDQRWNWDAAHTLADVHLEVTGELRNFWRLSVKHSYHAPALTDAEQGIVGTYRRPSGQTIQMQVRSDERKNLSSALTAWYGVDALQKKSFISQLQVTLRPASWMELSPMLLYARIRDEEAWVFPDGNISDATIGPRPFSVFGDRDVDEFDIALRGIVTFSRALSLQFYSQVLLARGRYENFRALLSPTTLVPYNYAAHPSYYSHDFNQITFNANMLLRWEYLPGSTLYLVWTQSRYGVAPHYHPDLGTRFRETLTLPREDVLLLKISYWLPL